MGKLSHVNEQNIFDFEEVEERERSPYLLPWIITGGIAIVAILVSLIVMNLAKADPEPAPETKPPVTEPVKPEPVPETGDEDIEEEPEEEPADPDRPDDAIDTSGVTIGNELNMPINHWDVSVKVSSKISDVRYNLGDGGTDPDRIIISAGLIDQLPDSCAQQRESWGMERVGANEYRALSPQKMCEENPSLYTELLGIVRHMADSVTPD